jgi:hypothetical protein
VKRNFNPQEGKKLLRIMREKVPNYNATVNSVRVSVGINDKNAKAKQTEKTNSETEEIEEISTEDMKEATTENIEECSSQNNEAFVQTVLVNDIEIGRACCPFEIIRVKVGSSHYPVAVIYDTGAQLSLCNYETGPVLISSKPADKRVTIATVNSSKAKLRKIYTLDLGNNLQIDAVLIPNLRLNLHSLEIPVQWQELEDDFADQDTSDVQAQILVGADKATIFPVCELNKYEKPVELGSCRLMRSRVTNKLIMFGACENEDQEDSGTGALHVNNVRANVSDDDTLIEPMNTLAINDIEPIHPDTNQD